jgi:succinoglycan biosynthesis transport protein ExoP
MSFETDEQTVQPFEIERYLDVVGRRHLLFLTVLFLSWAAIWGSSWILHPRYKSTTLILVEQPTMPTNYVVPNVTSNLQDRLQSLKQQILSRTRLLLIIEKLHLYTDEKKRLSPDDKVKRMGKDIGIDLVSDARGEITAFRISFIANEPHVAQQVTRELTNLFIKENLKARQQQSEDTTRFLQEQLDMARSNLVEQDAKVRAFQTAHEGSLPTQEASNLQILNGLQAQLQNEQDALNAARQQRVYRESMIDQYRTLETNPRTPGGAPTGLAALDQQLDTLKTKLADLSSRYTDRYPEVQDVKSEIAKTEKRREQFIDSLRKGANSPDQRPAAQAQDVTDPAVGAPLLQFQSQLKADEVEITNREQTIANLRSKINEYQARLNEEPAVAQRLADLTRGYTQSQTNYDDLLKKVSESQMATNMEQMQQGERFTMIDPPSLPLKPDFPNRMKMCGAGVGAGVALGFLVVALLEFLDDRIHNDGEIGKLLPTPIICEIPEILIAGDERRRRKRVLLGGAMAVTVMLVILAGAAFSYLKA